MTESGNYSFNLPILSSGRKLRTEGEDWREKGTSLPQISLPKIMTLQVIKIEKHFVMGRKLKPRQFRTRYSGVSKNVTRPSKTREDTVSEGEKRKGLMETVEYRRG